LTQKKKITHGVAYHEPGTMYGHGETGAYKSEALTLYVKVTASENNTATNKMQY
jgi:hypothetical protein